MASASSRIKFAIAFQGNAQCWPKADICAIDLVGLRSEVSAHSVGTRDSSLKAGRLKWCVPNKDSVRGFLEREKSVDLIALTPEAARAIQLTARVFESYENLSRRIRGLDGVVRPEEEVKRHDVPIKIEDHPELEEGKAYLITVQNAGHRRLKATFTNLSEQASAPQNPEITEEGSEEKALHALQRGLSGWLSMVSTLGRVHQMEDPELDALSSETLQTRFNEAVSRLKAARLYFTEACSRREGVEEALASKQGIQKEIMRLEAALNRKGVFPSYADTL